jgi:hypothetical protein
VARVTALFTVLRSHRVNKSGQLGFLEEDPGADGNLPRVFLSSRRFQGSQQEPFSVIASNPASRTTFERRISLSINT